MERRSAVQSETNSSDLLSRFRCYCCGPADGAMVVPELLKMLHTCRFLHPKIRVSTAVPDLTKKLSQHLPTHCGRISKSESMLQRSLKYAPFAPRMGSTDRELFTDKMSQSGSVVSIDMACLGFRLRKSMPSFSMEHITTQKVATLNSELR